MSAGQPSEQTPRPAARDNPSERGAWRELGGFLRRHWAHLVLSPLLGFVFCSALHEGAHAAAVVVQGGTIEQFRCWPGEGYLGYIDYDFSPGAVYSRRAVSAAPFVASIAFAIALIFIAFYLQSTPFWLGSSVFAWGWIASFGNIGIGTAGYLRGNKGADLTKVFGHLRIGPAVLMLGTLAMGCILGFYLQRRLYRESALSARAYLWLVTICVFGISVAAIAGRMM
jgi:hypothetical protein